MEYGVPLDGMCAHRRHATASFALPSIWKWANMFNLEDDLYHHSLTSASQSWDSRIRSTDRYIFVVCKSLSGGL